jgi:hypothetical protein
MELLFRAARGTFPEPCDGNLLTRDRGGRELENAVARAELRKGNSKSSRESANERKRERTKARKPEGDDGVDGGQNLRVPHGSSSNGLGALTAARCGGRIGTRMEALMRI